MRLDRPSSGSYEDSGSEGTASEGAASEGAASEGTVPQRQGRERDEGTGWPTQDDPFAEQETYDWEGTGASPDGGDAGDSGDAGGSGGENATVSQELFDRQGTIIDAWKERSDAFEAEASQLQKRNEALEERLDQSTLAIDTLKTENQQLRTELARKPDQPAETSRTSDAADKHTERLEQDVQRQERTIDRQEKMIERQDTQIGKLEGDNDRLRAKVAELESNGQSLEGGAVRGSSKTVSPQDRPVSEQDRPWYARLPSKAATDVITKAVTGAATIAVLTGELNSTAEKAAGAVATIGLGILEYRRQKSKREKAEDDD